MTYRALDRRANRLAQYLIGLGTKPGDHIGLLAERSIDGIVAILGILKSGAAFVPLEVDWPDARLAFLINKTDIAAISIRPAESCSKSGQARR